jgi:type II secretory pathway predicted ATPase ExeA
MYNKFFRFRDKPFEVTPDPKFLYLTRPYQEILSALIYGIRERRGFIAIVGEVGTGKTMMLNAMLDRLEHDTKVAFIFNSDLTFRQMLIMALYDLGLVEPEESLSKVKAIQRLNEFAIDQLERDGNVVIVVDEAQSLSHKTMENLRMLSNLETRKHKLVQIVLCGQPELDAKLSKPEWRQLVQRISLKRYSTNLGEEDTYNYVQHRLKVAGYEGEPLFDDQALQLIWKYSEGIPRKINVLCDNALLIAYGLETKEINAGILGEAIADLSWSPYLDKTKPQEFHAEDNQGDLLADGEPITQDSPDSIAHDSQDPDLESTINQALEESEAQDLEESIIPQIDEVQTTDFEEGLPALFEETHFEDDEESFHDPMKIKIHRSRSTLIAGILILVCLAVAAWFFIVKSGVDLGGLINLDDNNRHSKEMIDTERSIPIARSSSQIVDKAVASASSQFNASKTIESKTD